MRRDYTGSNNPNYKHGLCMTNFGSKKLHVARHPERIRARAMAQYAVKTGKLVKLPCEICGNKKTEAHHEDYNNPLDVHWMCRKHHLARHKEISASNSVAKA